MTHREKIDHMMTDLARRGLARYSFAPPLWRMAWALRLPLRPPHFMGFLSNLLLSGSYFGIAWGAAMWLLVWPSQGFAFAASAGGAAGLLFGLSMAVYYRWSAAKLKLPAWEEYPTDLPCRTAGKDHKSGGD